MGACRVEDMSGRGLGPQRPGAYAVGKYSCIRKRRLTRFSK
jgi:hypothetical protein